MGLNVNLVQMLGAPESVECPFCQKQVKTRFDDYDIECGNPNSKPAFWSMDCYCENCDKEFQIVTQLSPTFFTQYTNS